MKSVVGVGLEFVGPMEVVEQTIVHEDAQIGGEASFVNALVYGGSEIGHHARCQSHPTSGDTPISMEIISLFTTKQKRYRL